MQDTISPRREVLSTVCIKHVKKKTTIRPSKIMWKLRLKNEKTTKDNNTRRV